MGWLSVFQLVLIVLGAVVAAPFLSVGWGLLRADPSDYKAAQETSVSLRTVVLGEVPAERNGTASASVSAAITIEERRPIFGGPSRVVWREQGKLAREVVASLLRR